MRLGGSVKSRKCLHPENVNKCYFVAVGVQPYGHGIGLASQDYKSNKHCTACPLIGVTDVSSKR